MLFMILRSWRGRNKIATINYTPKNTGKASEPMKNGFIYADILNQV